MATHLNGFDIVGLIEAKWLQKGGQHGFLGVPISNAEPVSNGVDREGLLQRFAGGVVAWHPLIDGGAHEVHGLILARWHDLGEVKFGFPTTDEESPAGDQAGRYNHFRAPGQLDRSIYWHRDMGAAHEVIGWIRDKWVSLGWERSVLGYPSGSETAVLGGAVQAFQHGFMAWHPSIGDGCRGGAHEVHGAIGVRWNDLGGPTFGFPITDEEVPAGDQAARYNHFRPLHLPTETDRSIYWHRNIGAAHEVQGMIRAHWASLGWEKSKVGYPIGGERERAGSGRTQDFQNGAIAWAGIGTAWIDWFRLRRTVTTPPGTALGGWVEIELHENGHAFYRGHMHDSGAISYKFVVRTTFEFTPPSGPAPGSRGDGVLFQKAGEVEGGIDADRNFDWFEAEYHPILQANWSDVERGTFDVAKSYEKTGLIDDLGQYLLDAVSFIILSPLVGGHVAVSLLITKGLSSVAKVPIGGLGGAVGVVVVAGTSILMGPGYAIPIFIGSALVTNASFKQRSMTEEEYEFASIVFGSSLPPRDWIQLTNMTGLEGRKFAAPGMDGKTMLINIGDQAYSFADGPMWYAGTNSYTTAGQLLIHELVHAWQFHHTDRFIPGYLCRGPLAPSYTPPPAGSKWGADFGLEQEASTVDQWFGRHAGGWGDLQQLRENLNSPAARGDPYYRYIERNIRLGEDDHD